MTFENNVSKIKSSRNMINSIKALSEFIWLSLFYPHSIAILYWLLNFASFSILRNKSANNREYERATVQYNYI